MYAFLSSVSSWLNARTSWLPKRITKTFLLTQLSLWSAMLVRLSVYSNVCILVASSPVYLSVCQCFSCLSICPSVLLSTCLLVYLLSIRLPACLSVMDRIFYMGWENTHTITDIVVVYMKRCVRPSVSLFSCLLFICMFVLISYDRKCIKLFLIYIP